MMEQTTSSKWNPTDVLDGRYFVEKIFVEIENFTVWQMKDYVLNCPVWVLYAEEYDKEILKDLAYQLYRATKSEEKIVEILSIKTIAKRDVLIFSMKYEDIEPEVFLEWLVTRTEEEIQEEQTEVSEKEEISAEGLEQVLPADFCLDGRYRIIRCLGIGGFGITYLCEDIYLHRKVAVKEYFPEQWAERDEEYVSVKKSNLLKAFQYGMQSFGREIQVTAIFMHVPNIVTVYDAFKANDSLYMVMQFVEGISIGKEMRHREYEPYTPAEMADIILPLLNVLEEMHGKALVHSDISPGNIIRDKENRIVLIDMGAAKTTESRQPVLNASFLKLDYAAPEQYLTAKEGVAACEGPWTDVYAVGATMFYLLTGKKPMDVINRVNNENADIALPEDAKVQLTEEWLELIHRATKLDRKVRIGSVAELREGLYELLEIKEVWE
ncbi:MAG: serine/threonine protein kinase [Lachnospiraceae bacterium]|nr:serine/threonine protein kinase [Lachnospiraceae bacterium]